MASVRLTNEIREEITTAMLRHRFAKDAVKIVKMRAKLADRVYRDLYSAADRKRIESLPEGWLPSDTRIQFRVQGSYESVNFSGGFYGELREALPPKAIGEESRLFASKDKGGCVKTYDGGHPIADAYSEMSDGFKDLKGRFVAAKRQIGAALSKASTTKRLVELWPEAAPFVAEYEKETPSLPSIPTSSLNEMLDLPVAA